LKLKKNNERSLDIRLVGYWLIRLSLSVTFLASSILKAIDPRGTAYKIGDYLAAFHLSAVAQSEEMHLLLSVALCFIEFVLGIYLLFGIRRRFAAVASFLLTGFFALLTLYIWVYDPVSDCGCFGDAIVLTNKQTFIKGILLFVLAGLYCKSKYKTRSLFPENWHWFVSLYSMLFIVVFSVVSIYFLPMIDFRPYRVGVNIPKAMEIPDDAEPSVYENTFILRKNGKEERFTLENYPDSTWTFVRTEKKLIKQGDKPLIMDFAVVDTMGNDVTDVLLKDKYSFILVSADFKKADNVHVDEINSIVDYCYDHGYVFEALTASSQENIRRWQIYTGARYPIFQADATMLNTMIRSNPGLILLKNGTILAKWSHNNLPQISENINVDALKQGNEKIVYQLLKIILYYIIPLLFITFVVNIKKQDKTNTKKQNKMRKKIVAGNWKMNKNLQEGVALAKELTEVVKNPNCGVVICTPFIHLASVAEVIKGSAIELGAENCADKASGAYTGEVSAEMVKSTGAQYVILGHSERRQYYNETPEILKEKVQLALANGLKVIFCIGETLEEREANKQNEVVKAELAGSVYNLSAEEFKNIVIAYEPIWAIGTGKTATAEQAEEIHAYIRSTIAEVYGAEVAEDTTILYGGSCKASNAPELFAKPDIDGGLIGGASLKAPDFKGIIDAWN